MDDPFTWLMYNKKMALGQWVWLFLLSASSTVFCGESVWKLGVFAERSEITEAVRSALGPGVPADQRKKNYDSLFAVQSKTVRRALWESALLEQSLPDNAFYQEDALTKLRSSKDPASEVPAFALAAPAKAQAFGLLLKRHLESPAAAGSESPLTDLVASGFFGSLKSSSVPLEKFSKEILAVYQSPHSSEMLKESLIDEMAATPLPDFLPVYLKHFEEQGKAGASPMKAPDHYRFANAFAALLKAKPELLTDRTKKVLIDVLSSKDLARSPSRTYLESLLPDAVKRAIESEQVDRMSLENNRDLCEVECRLARHFAGQFENSKIPKEPYVRTEDNSPADVATRALTAELIWKAAERCEIPKGKETVLAWLEDLRVPTPQNTAIDSQTQKTLLSEAAPESRQRLMSFLNALEKSKPETGFLPPNSAFVFAVSHLGRLVKQVEGEGKPIHTALKESVTSQLSSMYANHKSLAIEKKAVGANSRYVTYHFAVSLLGFPGAVSAPDFQKSVATLAAESDSAMARYGNPNRFGYHLFGQQPPGKEEERALRKGSLSSAARAVPAQLAVYLNDQNASRKVTNADNLLSALADYEKHFFSIFSGIGEDRAHDVTTDDRLAVYYGPSTISYAFEAISALQKDRDLGKSGQEKLAEIAKKMDRKLSTRFGQDGMALPQSQKLFPAAGVYESAFLGLAAHEACARKAPDKKGGQSLEVPAASRAIQVKDKAPENSTHK